MAVPGVIPMACMLNHNTATDAACAKFRFDPAAQRFQVRTAVHYAPGDEVWMTYGDKTDSDWLIDYGMVVPGNQHNLIPYEWLAAVARVGACGRAGE